MRPQAVVGVVLGAVVAGCFPSSDAGPMRKTFSVPGTRATIAFPQSPTTLSTVVPTRCGVLSLTTMESQSGATARYVLRYLPIPPECELDGKELGALRAIVQGSSSDAWEDALPGVLLVHRSGTPGLRTVRRRARPQAIQLGESYLLDSGYLAVVAEVGAGSAEADDPQLFLDSLRLK